MFSPQFPSPLPAHSEEEPQNVTALDEDPVALILALGISGVTICPFCAPFAWFMGARTLRRIERNGVYDGWERTLVQVGYYLGIIGTSVLMVGVTVFLWVNVAGIPGIIGTLLMMLILLGLLFSTGRDK